MANEKRIRALAVGGLVEDNPLTSGATTLTSAGLAALPAIGSTEHAAIVLDPDGVFGAPEIAYVTAHTLGATTATIARAQEATTARQHDRDVPWIHGPTPADYPKSLRYRRENTGATGLQTSSTAWVDLAGITNGPGAGGYDMVVAAEVGDVIEYAISGLWGNEAVAARMDVATIVSAAIVNTFSGASLTAGTTYGVQAWAAHTGGVNLSVGASAWLTVAAGDLAAGAVTLRPYVRVDSATTKTFLKSTTNPMYLAAKNLGPMRNP